MPTFSKIYFLSIFGRRMKWTKIFFDIKRFCRSMGKIWFVHMIQMIMSGGEIKKKRFKFIATIEMFAQNKNVVLISKLYILFFIFQSELSFILVYLGSTKVDTIHSFKE